MSFIPHLGEIKSTLFDVVTPAFEPNLFQSYPIVFGSGSLLWFFLAVNMGQQSFLIKPQRAFRTLNKYYLCRVGVCIYRSVQEADSTGSIA